MKILKSPEYIYNCPECAKKVIIEWGYEEPEIGEEYIESCPHCNGKIKVAIPSELTITGV
jgi:DNA-directed RNA polymerase subunit RPC12/RpoP